MGAYSDEALPTPSPTAEQGRLQRRGTTPADATLTMTGMGAFSDEALPTPVPTQSRGACSVEALPLQMRP